jgi:hypothetical protein
MILHIVGWKMEPDEQGSCFPPDTNKSKQIVRLEQEMYGFIKFLSNHKIKTLESEEDHNNAF